MLCHRLTQRRLIFKATANVLSGDFPVLKQPLVALCSALMVSTVFVAPVSAQSTRPDNSTEVQVTQAEGRTRTRPRENRRQPAAPPPLTAEQIKAEAEAVLVSANTACAVSDSRLLGTTGGGDKFFEVACGSAPGYLLIASTPPQAIDCILVDHSAKQAAAAAAAAPAAEAPAGAPASTTPKCELAGNLDIDGFLKGYAAQAGVPCTVDQVAVKGQAGTGAVIYEVGCAGADGYWIEKEATAWKKTECLQIIAQNSTCAFTTPQEQQATVKTWLAGSEAAACNIGDIRLMGQNANGRFIELTCTGSTGIIVRHDNDFKVQQVYPCATAQQIGGGCTLPANKQDA